jgi:predicted DNA-binding transcriptional regulator YafY
VSRIVAVERLDERFERPVDFDLAARWAESSRAFERTMRNVLVELLVHADAVPQLRRAIDPSTYDTVQVLGERDDGRVVVTLSAESVEIILGHILWLGDLAEVVSPPELRDRVAGVLRRAADLYATGDDMASTSLAATAR